MRLDFIKVLVFFGFPMKKAETVFDEMFNVSDFEVWQAEKCRDVFQFHFDTNPFYREFVKKMPSKWEDIPVLTRNSLKGNFLDKIPASCKKKDFYQGNTSGSSGNPLFFAHDKMTHALIWKNVEYLYARVGISLNDRQARVFGTSKAPVPYYIAKLKDWLSNRYRFNIFDLSDSALEKWLQKFKSDRFQYLYGYTNSLLVFANYLIRKRIVLNSISPKLKVCITTSEVCSKTQRQTMEKAFGVKVYDEYGSSELGIMGFKFSDVWEATDELIYFEVLDEFGNVLPDGEIGILTCTSFFNKATPFIRYQPGDLASIVRKNGRTTIHQVLGSLNDMALLPSGKKVPGISFYFVAQELIESSHKVKEFLFRQTHDYFLFEYVAEEEITEVEFLTVRKGFDRYIEKGIALKHRRVDKLCRGATGKFKHFISSLHQ